MVFTLIKRLEWLIVLVLIQVLILNHIHIQGYATPFLYIYFILKFNTSASRNELMLWGFLIGLTIDIFSNTPGMNAAATVILAFARPFILNIFISRDTVENVVPSLNSLGIGPFIKYMITAVLLHHIFLLLIESFSFFSPLILLLKIVACALFTVICILAIELIRR